MDCENSLPSNERIVWADVETTGLRAGRPDQLLEIAVLITDLDLNILDEAGRTCVARHHKDVRDLADDYVKNMHDSTGLWNKVEYGYPYQIIDDVVTSYVKLFAPEPRQARLAGNSVRLDANFIDEFLPSLSAHLHYRILDVSSIAFEACEVRGVQPFKKDYLHEAMSDIRESIDELRYLRANR
jgi:Oligoribonuclease (3''->5'' exoribonuclease)